MNNKDSKAMKKNEKNKQSRREFIKRSGISAGVLCTGILGGNSYAARESAPGKENENPSAKGIPKSNESATLPFTATLPVVGHYDVVVCGGGPSGTAAALAAARRGLSVLLVEGHSQLGGNATSGLVSEWLGGIHQGKWIVGGIFRELSLAGVERGWTTLSGDPSFQQGVAIDPNGVALLLEEFMEKAGVEVLLQTRMVDAFVEGDRIRHIVLLNKSGLHAVAAKTVVDATGDADVAARSGCDYVKGRDEDSLMTPVTLEFHVDQVDVKALKTAINAPGENNRFIKTIAGLKTRNIWPWDTDRLISRTLTQTGVMMINTPRILGVDGTSGRSLSDGIRRGRKEIFQLMDIARKHFPGFENARIRAVAPALGVRETRRIRGDIRMTVEDLASGRRDDTVIALSNWGWDLPDPKSGSHQPMYGKKKPEISVVPYGVMVPRPVGNLICPGRAISVERDVLGPLREMAPCMAMGEAAGTAAVQVVRRGLTFATIDIQIMRADLREHGAILDEKDAIRN